MARSPLPSVRFSLFFSLLSPVSLLGPFSLSLLARRKRSRKKRTWRTWGRREPRRFPRRKTAKRGLRLAPLFSRAWYPDTLAAGPYTTPTLNPLGPTGPAACEEGYRGAENAIYAVSSTRRSPASESRERGPEGGLDGIGREVKWRGKGQRDASK